MKNNGSGQFEEHSGTNGKYNIPYFVFTSGEDGVSGLDWGVKFVSPTSLFGQLNSQETDSFYKALMHSFGLAVDFKGHSLSEPDLLLVPWKVGSVMAGFIFPYWDSSEGRRSNISLVSALIPASISKKYPDPHVVIEMLWDQNLLEDIAKRENDRKHIKDRPPFLSFSESEKRGGANQFEVTGDFTREKRMTAVNQENSGLPPAIERLFIPERLSWPDLHKGTVVLDKQMRELSRLPYWLSEIKDGEMKLNFVSPAVPAEETERFRERLDVSVFQYSFDKNTQNAPCVFVLPWRFREALIVFLFPKSGGWLTKTFSAVGTVLRQSQGTNIADLVQRLWKTNGLERISIGEETPPFLSFSGSERGEKRLDFPSTINWPENARGSLIVGSQTIPLSLGAKKRNKKKLFSVALLGIFLLGTVLSLYWWKDKLLSSYYYSNPLSSDLPPVSQDQQLTQVRNDRREELLNNAKEMFAELERVRNEDFRRQSQSLTEPAGLSGLAWIAYYSAFDSIANQLKEFQFAECGVFPSAEREGIQLAYPEAHYLNKRNLEQRFRSILENIAFRRMNPGADSFSLEGIDIEAFMSFKKEMASLMDSGNASTLSPDADPSSMLNLFVDLLVELDSKHLSQDNGYFTFAFKKEEGIYDFWLIESRKNGIRLGKVEHRHYTDPASETVGVDLQKAKRLFEEGIFNKNKKPYITDIPLDKTVNLYFVFSEVSLANSKKSLMDDFARQTVRWVLTESTKYW